VKPAEVGLDVRIDTFINEQAEKTYKTSIIVNYWGIRGEIMEIKEKSAGNVKILALDGRLDAYSSNEVESSINTLIDGGCVKIVVNFDGVEYISSSGLRVMLASMKRVKKVQGDLKLACLKPYVKEVFDLAGFTQLFEICDQEEEAVNSCTATGE
jgi:anti-sigma B factor antagonist